MRIEWKDNGLWYHALGEPQMEGLTLMKALHLLISHEFRSQIEWEQKPVLKSFYKSRDGALIPWIFKCHGAELAFLFLPHENPKVYDYRSLKQFVSDTPNSLGIVLGPEKTIPKPIGKNLWHLPYPVVF